jgi:hypothetical protein
MPDQEPPSLRPPSPAFALDDGEEGLSLHLESSLRAAGEQLTYNCPTSVTGWAVTRVTVGYVRSLGLRMERDALPHHVRVFGLANLQGEARRRM